MEDIGKEENRNYPQIWENYREIIIRVPFIDNFRAFGIRINTKALSEKGEDHYIAGSEIFKVTDIPEGAVLVTIPAQKYAVFTHVGNSVNFMESIQYIYEEWFPNNKKYERVPLVPELECYDGRFEQNSDDSENDYYIPIQTKEKRVS